MGNNAQILYINQTADWYKLSLESKANISDSRFKLLLGTFPGSIQLHALMQLNIQYESKMESLDSGYIVFDAILRRGKIKRCLIAAGWPVCPPDVVWEMLIDLLMKSGLLLSALSLGESVTLKGTPAHLTRWRRTWVAMRHATNWLHLSLPHAHSHTKTLAVNQSSKTGVFYFL